MPANPLTDVVSSQYERWMYPEPIQHLPGWLATNWQRDFLAMHLRPSA